MKNALPWIIGIAIVLVVAYFLYNRRKSTVVNAGVQPGLVGISASGNTSVIPSSQPTVQNCQADPYIVNLVNSYAQIPSFIRPQLKASIAEKCPAAAATLT